MDTQQEIFKPIVGYEGLYEISNFGRIKSLSRTCIRNNGRLLTTKERIRKNGLDNDGYEGIVLSKDGICKTTSVHRLVAKHFIGDSKKQVNHKDGNRANNHVSNLEWVTTSENLMHSYKCLGRQSAMKGKTNNGTKKLFGANNWRSKRIECFKDGVSIGIFESMNLAVKHFGFSNAVCVSRVARGERKSHMGYNFKFV